MKSAFPRLNISHPLARHVVASYDLSRSLVDTIGDGDAWTEAGTWSWDYGPEGWGYVYNQNGTGDTLTISSEPSWWDRWVSGDRFSIEFLLRPNADGGSFDNYYFSQVVSGSPFRLMELWFTRFGQGWKQSMNNGSGTNPAVAASVTGGEVCHVFCVVNGRDHEIHVRQNSTYSFNAQTAAADPATGNAFSSMVFGGANWDVDFGLIRFYDTNLDLSQIRTQMMDPFAVTRPAYRTFFGVDNSQTVTGVNISSTRSLHQPAELILGQTLAPPAIATGATLYTGAVSTPSVQAVTGTNIASARALYQPASISIATQEVAGVNIASTRSLHQPTSITIATQEVAGVNIASTRSLHQPTEIILGQTLSPPAIALVATLYTGTVSTPSAQTVTGVNIASTKSLHQPTSVLLSLGLAPPVIASGATLYGPQLNLWLASPAIASTEALYGGSVELSVAGASISSTRTIHEPVTLSKVQFLVPPAISATSVVYGPQIDFDVALAHISSSASIYQVGIYISSVFLQMGEIAADLQLGEVAAELQLTDIAVSLTSGGSPWPAVATRLTCAHIPSGAVLYGGEVQLGIQGANIASTKSLYSHVLASTQTLAAAHISSGSGLYLPQIQTPDDQTLTAPAIAAASTASAPSVVYGQLLGLAHISEGSATYEPTSLTQPSAQSITGVNIASTKSINQHVLSYTQTLSASVISASSGAYEIQYVGPPLTPQTLTNAHIASGASIYEFWIKRTGGAPADASAAVTAAQSNVGDFVGFTATLPTEPTTTSSATCTTPSEVTTALATNANHITITGDMTGSSFSIPTGRTDMLIDGSSVNIGTWSINQQCKRIKFDGVRMEGVDMSMFNATASTVITDVVISGCTFINGGRGGGGSCLNLRGQRILVENCTTEDEIQDYAIYCDNGLGTSNQQCTDYVIVNNMFRVGNTQACTRFYHLHRLVMTGNTLVSRSRHCFRLHSESTTYTTEDVYFSHNQMENRGFMFCSQGSLERVSNVLCQNTVQTMRHVSGQPTSETNSMTQFEQDTSLLFDFQFSSNWCATPGLDQNPGNDTFANSNPNPGGWTWSSNTCVDLDGTLLSST